MTWADWAGAECLRIRAEGRWRENRDFDARGITGMLGGKEVVTFASNDYLGLSTHPQVVTAAHDALDRWGAGTGAARLLGGTRPVHSRLEAELAQWKAAESALLFSSGFAANLGVLTALGTADTLICSDELNHASIVDGCRSARAETFVYPHRDVAAVGSALRDAARAIVVTDAVFSMDGDAAPVPELADVCRRHGALLVVDEAHAVLGPLHDLRGVEVLRIGTLSKFLGALGGFVAGPRALIELLINRARSFVFTTGTSPADAAAGLTALRVLRSPEGGALVTRLRTLVERVAPAHRSPIIPLVLGDEAAAVEASARMLERGLFVPAVRPPSVPPGTARLRVTLSSAHTDEQVDRLVEALQMVAKVPAGA